MKLVMFATAVTLLTAAPPLGFDVTPPLTTAGDFTALPASTAALMMFGGGVKIPVAHRWAVDAARRSLHPSRNLRSILPRRASHE